MAGYPVAYDERRFWDYARQVDVSFMVVRCAPATPDDMLESEDTIRHLPRMVEVWRNDTYCVLRPSGTG